MKSNLFREHGIKAQKTLGVPELVLEQIHTQSGSLYVYLWVHGYICKCMFICICGCLQGVPNINALWYAVLPNPIVSFNPFVWDKENFNKVLLKEWKNTIHSRKRSQTIFKPITTNNKLPLIRRTTVKRTKLTKWETPKRRQ